MTGEDFGPKKFTMWGLPTHQQQVAAAHEHWQAQQEGAEAARRAARRDNEEGLQDAEILDDAATTFTYAPLAEEALRRPLQA